MQAGATVPLRLFQPQDYFFGLLPLVQKLVPAAAAEHFIKSPRLHYSQGYSLYQAYQLRGRSQLPACRRDLPDD